MSKPAFCTLENQSCRSAAISSLTSYADVQVGLLKTWLEILKTDFLGQGSYENEDIMTV